MIIVKHKTDPEKSLERISVCIENEVNKVKKELKKYDFFVLDKPGNPEKQTVKSEALNHVLNHPFLDIQYVQGEVTLFWNAIHSDNTNSKNQFTSPDGSERFWSESTDLAKDQKIIITATLFDSYDSLMTHKILDLSKSKYHFKLSPKTKSTLTLNVYDKKYAVIPSGQKTNRTGLFFSFLFFYIFLITGITLLSRLHFRDFGLFHNVTTGNVFVYIAILVLLRLLIAVPIIKDLWSESVLFSDKVSTVFSGTIGDLILNVTFFAFITYAIISKWQKTSTTKPLYLSAYQLIGSFTFSSLFIYICYLCNAYIRNPRIHLEIERVFDFDKYSIVFLLCIIGLLSLTFMSSVSFFQWTKTYQYNKGKRNISVLGGILLSGITYYLLGIDIPLWMIVTFLAAYFLMLDLFTDARSRNITWLIWWMIVFSGFLAAVIFYNGVKKEIEQRKKFVHSYYVDENSAFTKVVNDINQKIIDSDIFEKLGGLPYLAKLDRSDLMSYIDQITKEAFKSDITPYVADLECFDSHGYTIFSNHFSAYNKIKQSIRNANSNSENDYVFYNPFENKYYISHFISNDQHPGAPFHLILSYDFNANQKNTRLENTSRYFHFSVFKNDQVIEQQSSSSNRMDIKTLASLEEGSYIRKGVSYVVHKPSKEVKVVAFKEIAGLIKPISLFSYLFTLLGLTVLLITIINSRSKFLFTPIDLRLYNRSSLRTRIQLVIIALILFSFVLIGMLTAYYFNNVLENNERRNIEGEATAILNNIQSNLKTAADDESARVILNNKLKEFASIHDKALSLYDENGFLISQSDKTTFDGRMPFLPWTQMNKKTLTNYLEKPDGNNNQWNAYIPLYHDSDKTSYAYLGIAFEPFHLSSRSLIDFLSTILNVYVFLFLLAGAIAILIANSITKPLSVLADKLKRFKLGKQNEPLQWDSKDEIGTLIKDYNNLIVKLEESADIIAMTERDTAWREMAKQVAHEIKNPLTPMKLSIQYLEKAFKSNPSDPDKLVARVANTLIEQIDNLTQIANEFSNFGKMPKASNEKIVLNEIVEAVHDLFRKREDMDINLIEPIDDLFVFADRNHLVRILNNVVKNAIQAIPTDRRGKIKISLSKEGPKALIVISDNGVGISEAMKSKVFTPNFTTKNSGTGLGLAISANMLEAFNGKIYFETEEGKGTDFFIEIPLMRLETNFKDVNRVSL